MNWDLVAENRFLSIFIMLVAIVNILQKLKQNTLLTATGGLHFNLLIFYGIGPLADTFTSLMWDFFRANELKIYTNQIQIYVAICYTAYTIYLQYINRKKKFESDRSWFGEGSGSSSMNSLSAVVLILSIIGYLFSQDDIALSGAGTIFPVLKNLLFPCLVMVIYNVHRRSPMSIVLLFAGFALVGINAFFSTWRSELILFVFSIGIGLILRNKKFLYYGVFIGPLMLALLLPFQFLKKTGKIKEDDSWFTAFTNTFENPGYERGDLTTRFLAFRLNYARESAYVLRGIQKGFIDYRYGDTYEETVLQLIPRVLWPEKPSYNYLANRVIPRQIGLVNKLDLYTSWGVNYYAEFLYNFQLGFFPFFFAFYFWLLSVMDRICVRMKLSSDLLRLLQITLFFQVLSTVTLSAASTYFLWIFIVIKLMQAIRNLSRNPQAVKFIR